ncbi:hypothetical protein CEXT_183751 [Caerostris extrusa]|uniref:Uncharacterized protein n=1 Tax=Caerostris extrusa TaxID=172846 RepID=A0AAV4MHM5_CAEEX|nr:hypothetical protein CEXT_183751 [Caerostris extrusa]
MVFRPFFLFFLSFLPNDNSATNKNFDSAGPLMQAVTFNTPNYQQSVDLGKGLGGEGCIIKSPFSHHCRIAGSFGNDDFLCKRFGNVSKCRRGFQLEKSLVSSSSANYRSWKKKKRGDV